ncbi:UDP-3-O-[3-hydroxymyristoyl] glucosamine N-acyltransferase [hydrothermal vent metagenome]|uniref:UDP-3-O-[3-hydroxymyristoyl] glucosamine N-acyltransferase n=1 Tax=hydrothermal vent metagenome TaxID=652676 RepID=A0A3B1E6W6_9ZZZZ
MKIKEILKLTSSHIENKEFENIDISSLNTLKDATDKDLSFFNNFKYKQSLLETKALAVVVAEENKQYVPKKCIAIINPRPNLVMAKLSKHFFDKKYNIEENAPSIDSSSIIDEKAHIGFNAKIGKNTKIMAGAYVGNNVSIGDNCIIYPNVSIYDFCTIKDNTFIHSNTTIGADGFGYEIDEQHNPIKIYHIGNVEIGSNVEIGVNTAIDKGVLSSTKIGDYCKIDNLINIAHNCVFGNKVAVMGGCTFAGSVTIGNNVIIYGESSFVGHISICDNTTIMAKSVVLKNITKSGTYAGFPVIEHKKWLKQQVILRKLIAKNEI